MANPSKLTAALAQVGAAFERLDAAIDIAMAERLQSAQARESIQSELTASWEVHSAKLEAELAEVQAESHFLKEDNTRLANQLQDLQQEYLDLQATASTTLGRLDKSVKQLDLMLEH